jgi:hypothetical protein
MISIRPVRRAGVPLVIVETSDATQTIQNVIKDMNGGAEKFALVQWDVARGAQGVNEVGKQTIEALFDSSLDTLNATDFLTSFYGKKWPERAVIFCHNLHLFWNMEPVVQAIWNLRDLFKTTGSTLLALVPVGVNAPAVLKNDVVTLTDTLPTSEEVDGIIESITKDAGLTSKAIGDRKKVHDTLLGLSAFGAEQVLAMSVSKEGLDHDGLWERKRRMIEQTPGLSVWRGGETFEDVGGYSNAKKFLKAVCNGEQPPRAIVFIDEIEKSMAASGTDSSGVSQDYLRTLLTFMQDKEASGVILIGPPGSGKSAIAKATGNEAGIPTIALDLGGMKGSLVGESEQRLRTALQVVDAVSQGQTLFIATCNSISILPPELRRRFSFGTFFFPLPSADDRKNIWRIYFKRFGLKPTATEMPNDEGWTGAEIRNCCTIAHRLRVKLNEAATYIVPVSVSAKEQIERLSREASQKFINAAAPGLYKHESEPTFQATARRMES